MVREIRAEVRQISLLVTFCVAVLMLSACAVPLRPAVPSGTIPPAFNPTVEAEQFGQTLFEELGSVYEIDTESARYHQLMRVFNELAESAGVDLHTWQVYLFDAPRRIDVRAVHGNFLFVWSGVFAVVESDDEMAGLLACELAHVLARHTDPVRFSVATELMFALADIATTVGVAAISQGILSVNAPGLMRRTYIDVADLDPLDRVYNAEEVEEMAAIALLILTKSPYSPNALRSFWARVEGDASLRNRVTPLLRDVPPRERIALLEAITRDLTQRRRESAEQAAAETVQGPLGQAPNSRTTAVAHSRSIVED